MDRLSDLQLVRTQYEINYVQIHKLSLINLCEEANSFAE